MRAFLFINNFLSLGKQICFAENWLAKVLNARLSQRNSRKPRVAVIGWLYGKISCGLNILKSISCL